MQTIAAPHPVALAPSRWRAARCLALAAVAVAALAAPLANAQPTRAAPAPVGTLPEVGPIDLHVDATDLPHRILRVTQHLPVKPGALKLLYPLWIPGHHAPTGQVGRLAGLEIDTDTGQRLAWQRDAVEPQAFHVTVPAGAQALVLRYQGLTPIKADSGRVAMTPSVLNVQWESALLYPSGHDARAITLRPRLTLPSGWQAATALRPQGSAQSAPGGDTVAYAPVSLEQLIDSPVWAGRHVRRIALDDGAAQPVALHLLGERAQDIEATAEQVQAHRNLVVQADKLFGTRHFAHYDFLLAIGDELGGIGLEHHQSSENAVPRGYFKDWDKATGTRDLLPHEYVHSWNGKYRRPADLTTPHFNTPMQTSLLWLYEGQTQFWGRVLTARSQLETLEQALQNLAHVAATYQGRAGRQWRNLQDTTQEGPMMARSERKDWDDWQRGADYYDEATLLWIEADALMREQTGGQRGLDDFARAFFGGQNGDLGPRTYTFDDIVAALNAVAPRDWAAHLRQRLDAVGQGALDVNAALARAGWRLVFKPEESAQSQAESAAWQRVDFAHSLGLTLSRSGELQKVAWESPAYRAGLARGQQIVAVNGLAFEAEGLKQALQDNTQGQHPIELIVKEGPRYRTVRLDYRGGPRYPALERIAGQPDRLTDLLSPR